MHASKQTQGFRPEGRSLSDDIGLFSNPAVTTPLHQQAVLRTLRRGAFALMLAAVPAALAFTAPAAWGQASASSDAAGVVTDASGAAIPDATIHLINNGTKAERTTKTNGSGAWSIPNLPPANYSIRVEKEGFKTSVIPSIDVQIGQTANGSVQLAVGGTSETIEVNTLPPQLQTQEATIGQVIDQKQINDLPLNGRNVLQLATLAPGVSPPQTGQTGSPAQTGTSTPARQLYITVDGARGNSTNYVLDGTYVRSVRFNNMSLLPNTDTLQEFNLLRSTFSTEYGQGQAVVSMVTKSGTNTLHGSGYFFVRNGIFDARSYFQTVGPKPDFHRYQFGGTFGGPIIKDKLFVFGGYEGYRSSKGNQSTAYYPTQAELGGDASGALSPVNLRKDGTRCTAATAAPGETCVGVINPTGFSVTNKVALALNPTYPVITQDATPINGNSNYSITQPFTDNYDSYTVRGDWTINSKSSLFGRYANYNASQITPAASGSAASNPLLGRNAVLGNTYLVNSKIVNEVRIGWNEFYNIGLAVLQNAGPNGNWAAAEGLTNVTALTSPRQNGRASYTITGYANVGDGAGDQGGHENVISIGDSLSDVMGSHTLKVGFQYQNRRLWQIADNNSRGSATFDNCTAATYNPGYIPSSPNDTGGGAKGGNCAPGSKAYQLNGVWYYYNKFQNYARGMCTSSCNGNAGTSLGHYRDNTYGAFFNDVWQLHHGLTLNIGLRWEYNQPFHEQNGLEGSLDPDTQLVTFVKLPANIPQAYLNANIIDTKRTYRPGIIQPYKKGFMPRLGLAYEAHPGTVFRLGYGIYFDNLNTNELQFTRYAAPLYFQQTFTNYFVNGNPDSNPKVPGLYPDPLNTTQIPSPFSIFPNNKQPLTQEWNVSLQQDLGHGLMMEMAYTGSNSHHMWKRYDQNMCKQYPFVIPDNISACERPNSAFGAGILTSSTLGAANFNGGSIKIEKRQSHGLYYLGSYQWSKNLDNISGEAGANDSSYATTTAFDHSYSNFDVRNRAVISGGYELPFGKNKAFAQGKVGNAILGGWSFQPAVQLRTGYPFNVLGSGCSFASYNSCRVWLAPGRTVASSYKANRSISNWFDATAYSQDPNGVTVTGTPGNYTSGTRVQPNLQGWVTRNTGRGPGTVSFDLSGIKNFKVGERLNMQFRAEAYNIINHGIFSNPGANLGTPSSLGKISGTSMDNRSLQFAIKGTF